MVLVRFRRAYRLLLRRNEHRPGFVRRGRRVVEHRRGNRRRRGKRGRRPFRRVVVGEHRFAAGIVDLRHWRKRRLGRERQRLDREPGGGSTDASAGSGGAGPSDGSSGRADARPEVVQACTAFAAMFCGKVRECTPFVLGALYGDAATCESRVILGCLPSFDVPGTSASPAKTSGCGQAIAGLTCATFLTGDLGASCKTDPGTIANGGACGDDAQCVSTFCARAPDASCGVCAPATRPNDPCVRGSCSAGTVCPAGQSTCITPTPGKVDDACTAQEQCDLAHGIGCNAGSGKCLSLTLAAGGNCGANSIVPTSYAVCPASGTCSAPLGGRCSAAAADGQACSTADTGTHCLTPARCVASKCVVPDPSSCR